MKNLLLACFIILGLGSCGINKQAQQIKALEIKLVDGLPPDQSRAAEAAILAQTRSN